MFYTCSTRLQNGQVTKTKELEREERVEEGKKKEKT